MSSTWMFAGLNQLDPLEDPTLAMNSTGFEAAAEGLGDLSDYPSAALNAQLETWSNLTFDFSDQSPFDSSAYAQQFEEKVDGEDDEGARGRESSLRSSSTGGRNHQQVYGLLDTAEQARQFQQLLLESSSSLDPSLSYPPVLPLSSTSTADHYMTALLPDFKQPPVASTSALRVASQPPPLLDVASDTAPLTTIAARTRSSPSSTTTKRAIKKVKVEKVVPVTKSEPEEEDELDVVVEGDEETSLEDKRKRNTAASARFRIKKKQREAALEDSAKALRDRVISLEEELKTLKTENNWLRGMIMNPAGTTDNPAPSDAIPSKAGQV